MSLELTRKEETKDNDSSADPMADAYRTLIKSIGEDLTRPGLLKTPQRAADALRFLCQGYEMDIDKVVNGAIFPSSSSEIVLVRDIELYSMCEHHLLPFIGKAHVAYIPDGRVIGLSKIARIVDVFARRLQIQEELTTQVAHAIQKYTGPKGVAVVIEAQHLCMMMRGVSKQNSVMKTSCLLGEFHDDQATRAEFFSLIK